jgi:hypothetical protein
MSRLTTAGISGDRGTLIADGHAECDWIRHQFATHDEAGVGEGLRLLNKVRSDGVKTNDQWVEFAKASGEIYCPDLKKYGDQNPVGVGGSTSESVTAPSSNGGTMSPDQMAQFKARVDAALDEVNPAKETLVAALRTHDLAAIHIGCRPVGQAGRDLSAALATGRGYVLTDRIAELVARMQRAADALERAERDCSALGPFSSDAEWDQVLKDMQEVADEFNRP